MRTKIKRACVCGALLTLGGCGGDGGSVNSVSTTPVTNTSLASLTVSQSFANNAATHNAVFDLNSDTTTTGSSTNSYPLTISYDASSKSYTLSIDGRSQTFAASAITSQANGVAVYKVSNTASNDYLTLEAASFTGAISNSPQYSGIGYWQRNAVSGTTQTTSFDVFTYGIDTPVSAVPRTGQAAFNTIVLALQTQPGVAPLLLQGTGRTDVDFLDGILTTSESTTETNLVTNASTGSSSVYGQGTMSSSGNSFTGTISVYGTTAHSSGTLNGQFYGPAGQELGGAFSTSGSDGSAVSGAIWGITDTSLTPANMSLTNLVATQQFYAPAVMMTELQNNVGDRYAVVNPGTGSFNVTTGGTYMVGGVASNLPSTTFTSADEVTSSNANFTRYQQSYGGGTIGLDLYKTGSANSELQLTYSSFGAWQGPQNTIYGAGNIAQYFVYGINTLSNLIAARTGSANYTGVAYATAYNATTNTSAGLNGTASFAVNFDIGGYSGSFGLKNTSTNYGTFNVSGTLAGGAAMQGSITGVTAGTGQFSPAFYGPTGQEFGGPFQITIPASKTTIVGAALSKGG